MSGLEVLERIRRSDPDVMVIIVTGYGTFGSLAESIDLDVFEHISKPFNVQEVRSVVGRCLESRKTLDTIKRLFSKLAKISTEEPSEFHHHAIAEDLGHLGFSREDFGSIKNAVDSVEVCRLVSKSVEKRDRWRTGHSERVSRYTDLLVERLNLSHSVKEELKLASYVHDIGMVFVSNRLTNKARELLGTDWALVRRHPIKSTELLEPLGLCDTIMSAVRYHHERFDGAGYPDGLCGADIPLGARIISLGDVYDSLRSNSPCQNAMGHEEASAEIHRCGGTRFDPDLVPTFLEALKEEKEFLREQTTTMKSTRKHRAERTSDPLHTV
jgi:response regulator RpfG family c-di-GMP phosphodiesterase